jgi:hypothetical protein
MEYQNIYITSDEEIKEGDWSFELHNGDSKATSPKFKDKKGNNWWLRQINMNCSASDPECKKIILTTDETLIKDGVQAIPDEFLEWFVKNPSCENVEVEYGDDGNGYQIIIPKEEPKQETLEEVAERYSANQLSQLGFINGAKWQQQQNKNLYSEEDLHNAFYNGWLYRGDDYTFPKAKQEWLTQFKKK